ncbi:hypothetical protein C5167_043774 [Papaver somniferum]|uniref:Uncharacterized protein n=1 Tax=Papaver somniferum TaxID=3469 RepID=A0A4Y7LAK2_PAPSO|nr:hypothetical protein C5167_043774 [Papaver somniferum]
MSQFMEELKSAMNEHMDLMSDLVEKFSGELRVGLQSAVDNFLGFFHVNMLFSLCQIMVKWKRAELKHKARAARNKQE